MPRSHRYQTDPDIERGSFTTPPRQPSSSRSSSRRTPQDVSPAETFDTAMTTPMSRTFDESDNSRNNVTPSPPPPSQRSRGNRSTAASNSVRSSSATPAQPQTVEISHKIKNTGGGTARSAGLMLGMSRPFILMAVLFAAAAAAAGLGWFQIPGLQTQVKALEEQVANLNIEIGRLSSEVDRLEDENDRYEDLNDQLNKTVEEIEMIVFGLNLTVDELEDVANRLNITNQDLIYRIGELAIENSEYKRLNNELNSTVATLSQEVEAFEDALEELIIENSILSNLTETLEQLAINLNNTNIEQNQTLMELRQVLAEFMAENDRLQTLNEGLINVVSFLNETSLGLETSLQSVTEFLSEQISINKVLVIESLESTYRQKVDNWDCDYRDIFREQIWGVDFNLPITDLDSVLMYVNDNILSELCLDQTDFTNQLTAAYPETGSITTFRLVRSVLLYTDAALDHYFNDETNGVTYEDWAAASFRCENLSDTFSWDSTTNGSLAS